MSYRDGVLETYAASTRRAVVLATAEARQLGHPLVGSEHLLLGLLANGDDVAASALTAAGATLMATRHKVAEATGPGDAAAAAAPEYTPRAQRSLDRAVRFARQDRGAAVGPQHLLLGVLDVEGLACQVLRGLGVDLVRLRDALVDRPAHEVPPPVEPAPLERLGPRCPTCAAALDDTLSITRLGARLDDARSRPVDVVHCGACGTTLGALPPAG